MVVAVAAVVGLAIRLTFAATTFGSRDIGHWMTFTSYIPGSGPIGIYGVPFEETAYNHPPLMGYVLVVVSWLESAGVPVSFSIRALSSVIDVAGAFVVFALLRQVRSLGWATAGGVAVALSPALILIAGFHGNTDPVFVMLTLLALYLLQVRRAPVLAGLAMAAALGVKIVAVVAVPVLLVLAWRQSPRAFWRFGLALAGFSLLWWGPALALQGAGVLANVVGYAGWNNHVWGIDRLATWWGWDGVAGFIEGPGRMLIVALCALLPAWWVWRSPGRVLPAVAMTLVGFLVLTPTFGVQYLAWAAAPVLLLTVVGGVVFNVLAGLFLLKMYSRWTEFVDYNHPISVPFTTAEVWMALVVWLALVGCAAVGLRRLVRP